MATISDLKLHCLFKLLTQLFLVVDALNHVPTCDDWLVIEKFCKSLFGRFDVLLWWLSHTSSHHHQSFSSRSYSRSVSDGLFFDSLRVAWFCSCSSWSLRERYWGLPRISILPIGCLMFFVFWSTTAIDDDEQCRNCHPWKYHAKCHTSNFHLFNPSCISDAWSRLALLKGFSKQ